MQPKCIDLNDTCDVQTDLVAQHNASLATKQFIFWTWNVVAELSCKQVASSGRQIECWHGSLAR